MANTVTKKTKKTNAHTAKKVARKSTEAGKSGWVGIFLFIIVAAALAGGGYVWQQLHRSNVVLFAEQSALGKRIDQLGERLNERLAERLADTEKSFADSIAALRSELGGDDDQRNLEEIERLLEIANQRLQLSADIELAKRALQLADDRLRRLSHSIYTPALAPVRELIADEIASLNNTATVDVVGTLNALSVLADSVNDLPLAGDVHDIDVGDTRKDANDDDSVASSSAQQGDGSWWWDAGKNLVADLGALVQVDIEGKSPPILSTELRMMVVEKTGLIIESCQLAFLREQEEVYGLRMTAAKNWVTANFNTDSAKVGAWLERWTPLAAVSPQAELPDISGSLRSLRAVMDAQ